MRNYKSLLPSHKTKDEKTLEKIGADLLAKFDLSVIDNNPKTCDKKLLKHLAYQYDVDINNLSESEARNLLSQAFLIHRYAGTHYGLKKALTNYDENLNVIDDLGNYQFKCVLELKSNLANEKLEHINTLVNKYKNVRSICTGIEVKQATELNIKLAPFICIGKVISVYPKQPKNIVIGGGVGSAIAVHIINKQEIRNV
ncbi:phage tail protein [Campylobacter sp. RM9334]|uniref:phage tail protein n=1 Tax=Campylobacter sp. RM9334 TaxID=2735732 RepID=UPI001E056398|nr:phage tail protein [Campylobacter sp. RM9334]